MTWNSLEGKPSDGLTRDSAININKGQVLLHRLVGVHRPPLPFNIDGSTGSLSRDWLTFILLKKAWRINPNRDVPVKNISTLKGAWYGHLLPSWVLKEMQLKYSCALWDIHFQGVVSDTLIKKKKSNNENILNYCYFRPSRLLCFRLLSSFQTRQLFKGHNILAKNLWVSILG